MTDLLILAAAVAAFAVIGPRVMPRSSRRADRVPVTPLPVCGQTGPIRLHSTDGPTAPARDLPPSIARLHCPAEARHGWWDVPVQDMQTATCPACDALAEASLDAFLARARGEQGAR